MPRPAADEVFKEQGGIAKTYTVSEKTLSAINQMVRDNKAKVVSQSKVVTKSGMPAQSIAVNQFSYPANFELHAEETIKAGEDSGQVRYVISPTEIDERECGTIFELEPTIRSDGKTIDWKMNPQRVRISSQPWKMSAQATGKQELEIPRFITEAVTSQIITKDGDTVLMSVCDSTDNMEKKDKPCDNVILWLVTAWIIPVK
jgi:type II secretory pathway component GspD/PulD (secretin)